MMRLTVHNFRNYRDFTLQSERQLVALAGKNGIGKTNLLEALSLFAPGRGLRYAPSARLAPYGTQAPISLVLTLSSGESASGVLDTDPISLSLGLTPTQDTEDGSSTWTRHYRFNGENLPSHTHFSDYCRFVWVTPTLDSLFNGTPGGRRRFLDRLVVSSETRHGAHMVAFERALRSRRQLLDEGTCGNNAWLEALEHEIAALGADIAQARLQTVNHLQNMMGDAGLFPQAHLKLSGYLEEMLAHQSLPYAKEQYQILLRTNRGKDRAAGRTLIGPHTADLHVTHVLKNLPSHLCSTGEQKALLLSIILAHTRTLKALYNALTPPPRLIVLLDEIAAHLDAQRRTALFYALTELGATIWMTGTDPFLFSTLPENSELFTLEEAEHQPMLTQGLQLVSGK
jgi:DNA replication and repair protein RecF